MNNKNMVPKIRFNAYTVNWRHCKFSDLIQTMHGGASIAPADYRESGIPTVPKGAINSTGTANLSGSKYVSKEFFEKKISSCVYPGSLVTSLRDLVPTAPNMGRIVKLKGQDDKYLMPQGVYRLNLNNDVNERFLISFSNSNKYRKIISQEKNGSTQVHIRSSQYLGVNLSVPSSEEQEKIGSFFNKLDKTITLQQQLLDDHKQLKKAMLQKMFPQKAESVPRVRFTEFNNEWAQKKLGEIYEKSSYRNKDLEYGKEKIISVSKMRFKDTISKSNDDYMKTYNVLKKDEIAFEGNKSKNYKYGRFVLNDIGDGIVSHVFIVMKPKVILPSNFIKEYINNENIMQKILLFSTTSTLMMTSLNSKEFLKQKIRLPSFKEQEKIGNFFKKLDETIVLYEQKLETYQELKKAMLQKMFV